MKKYEELHELIHCMDMQEKRYFKLFATRHVIGEENKYVKLFDVIAAMPECNDALVRKKFRNDYIARHYPVAKQYLFNLIQRSLVHYHDNDDPEARVIRYLRLTDIFITKGRYDLCGSIVKKAAELCEKFEFHPYALRVNDTLRVLAIFSSDLDKMKRQGEETMEKCERILSVYRNLLVFQNDLLELKHDISTGSGRLKKTSLVDKLILEKRYRSGKEAFSNNARLTQLMIINNYNYLRKDRYTHLRSLEMVLEHFEKGKAPGSKNKAAHAAAMHNYILACINYGREEEYEKYLVRFLAMAGERGYHKPYIFEKYISLKVEFFLVHGNFTALAGFIEEAEILIRKYGRSFSLYGYGLFYIACSIALVNTGEVRHALRWNNKVLNDERFRADEEIYRDALLLHMLLHLALGNFSLLRTKINAIMNYYSQTAELSKVEKIYFDHVQPICTGSSKKRRTPKLEEITRQLDSVDRKISKQN